MRDERPVQTDRKFQALERFYKPMQLIIFDRRKNSIEYKACLVRLRRCSGAVVGFVLILETKLMRLCVSTRSSV